MPTVNISLPVSRLYVPGGGGGGDGASVVSGELIINDTGFSSKSTAGAYYVSDEESGTAGNGYATIGLENLGTDGTSVTIANDRSYYGTKSVKCIYPTGVGGEAFPRIGKLIDPGSLDLYHSCVAYWDIITGSISPSPIFKWGRAGGNTTYSGQPSFHDTIRPNGSGVVASRDTGFNNNGVDYYDPVQYGQGTILKSQTKAGWHFVEYVYRLSTPGGNDGLFQCYVDGTLLTDEYIDEGTSLPAVGFPTRETGDTSTIDWSMSIFDGNSNYGNGNRYDLWANRIAMDVALNRCIVTDHATYASSTKWAYQDATTWTNTQIKAQLFAPPSMSGQTAYAHVWDEDGAYVDSYSFTVP